MYKKIFLSLFIFLGFLLCVNINNCFASFDVDFMDNTYHLADIPTDENYPYYIVFCFNNDNKPLFKIYLSDKPFKYITTNGYWSDRYNCYTSQLLIDSDVDIFSIDYNSAQSYPNCSIKKGYISGSSNNDLKKDWNFTSDLSYGGQGWCYLNGSEMSPTGKIISNNSENIYFIKTSNSNNHISSFEQVGENAVFQLAPQEEEQTQGILNTTTTSTDFSQVMKEVLMMLPILLVILILNLSLRKAIKILFELLDNA